MYRCRHEQDEDRYASGNDNRRRNRDKLNRNIEIHDFLRCTSSSGYELPFGGPPGYGLGPRGSLPFGMGPGSPRLGPLPFDGLHGRPMLPFSPFSYDDSNFDSDDESPPPWNPPPWYSTSPVYSPRLRCPFGGRGGGPGFRRPYGMPYDDYDDYGTDATHVSRLCHSRRPMRY